MLVALGIGLRYAGESEWRWLDESAVDAARELFPGARGAAYLLIRVFDPLPFAVLVAVLAGLCLALRRPRLAVLAVAGPVLTGVTTTALKPVFDRVKNGEAVYPSGHMGAATSLALVTALLVVSVVRVGPWLASVVVAAATMSVGLGVALAMAVTRYHYPTDAVGGFCVAVAVVLGLALLIERFPVPRGGRAASAGGAVGLPKSGV